MSRLYAAARSRLLAPAQLATASLFHTTPPSPQDYRGPKGIWTQLKEGVPRNAVSQPATAIHDLVPTATHMVRGCKAGGWANEADS